MTRRLRALFSTYRVRMVLAFALVVAVALGLVLATLPRLLDGYLLDQEKQNLRARTDSVVELVLDQLTLYQTLDTGAPRALLFEGPPITPGEAVVSALGTPSSGFLAGLTPKIALANLTVSISPSDQDREPVYSVSVPLSPSAGQPGQQQEPLTYTQTAHIADVFWATHAVGAPMRLITVTLSQPFTNRALTTQTITSVLLVAASLALLAAIVASVVLAQRLTGPIRRLTVATSSLAEGRLDSRVPTGPGQSPEVAELAGAFNHMADRLQDSIEIMSQDRDRSRAFLADVSHELRTPIAALRTFVELLQGGAGEDPQARAEFLEQSARQVERLDWLSTNLLDLSKLDSGLVALDLRPDDLRAVVENAVEQAQPVADRKGVALVMKLPDTAVRQLHDPPRIGQVLANLIGNAIKFTPQGGRVEVELESTPDGAELSVTDTGSGIRPEELPHVFERFYRGTMAEAERGSGSGLGLSIAKSIVDMHAGRISIQTSPGAGTQVVVTLPRDMTISSPPAAQP